jgi:hypothetical protein
VYSNCRCYVILQTTSASPSLVWQLTAHSFRSRRVYFLLTPLCRVKNASHICLQAAFSYSSPGSQAASTCVVPCVLSVPELLTIKSSRLDCYR